MALLGEVDEGKVRLGLGMVLVVEARPCALEMAASPAWLVRCPSPEQSWSSG